MDSSAVPPFRGVIFGCDKCLDACPWNSANKTGWNEFHKNAGFLRTKENGWWEELSTEEFKNKFKDSSLLRGGLDNIKASIQWSKKGEQNE